MRNGCLLVSGIAGLILAGCDSGDEEWVPAPHHLTVTGFARDLISLSWVGSDDVDGYRVERKTGAGPFEFKADINNPWTWGYSDHTVVEGTTYSYRVTAFRPGVFSNPSNTVTAAAEDYYVTVTYPNGSEELTLGETFYVEWETNWPEFDARVDLSVDNGITWENILHGWAPRKSPWEWKVGGLNRNWDPWDQPYWEQYVLSTSTECLIRIEHYVDGIPMDESDATFTITVDRGITVTSPNGTEGWVAGSSGSITWTSINVASVRIELSRNNGLTWQDIVASTDAAAGSYDWTVTGPASTECLVRVRDATYELPEDASDATFTITVP